MNSLVIYFSKFGHTQLVAETVGTVLKSHGPTLVVGMDQVTVGELTAADLVVAGTPTHKMNLPETVRPFLDTLPRRILNGTPVAAFDTSYRMSPFQARFTAAKKLARKLHGKRVVSPETFHVEGREGPLYPGELDRARDYAARILDNLPDRAPSA
ncbi:flavodoxin family protein [Candidatus Neomarinimicrobiota bacterium]